VAAPVPGVRRRGTSRPASHPCQRACNNHPLWALKIHPFTERGPIDERQALFPIPELGEKDMIKADLWQEIHSRSLTVADHETRFPGVLRNRLWPNLRHLPTGFTLDPYFDARGHPALPIAKGLVSWVRKVDAHGCIEFNGAEYFIRRKLERQYVVATLSTHHRTVYIKYDGKLKTLPFPFTGKTIDPLC